MRYYIDSATVNQLWWAYHNHDECVTQRVIKDRLRALAAKLLTYRVPYNATVVTYLRTEYTLGEALLDVAPSIGHVRAYQPAQNLDEYKELVLSCDQHIILPVPSELTRLQKIKTWTELTGKTVRDLSRTWVSHF